MSDGLDDGPGADELERPVDAGEAEIEPDEAAVDEVAADEVERVARAFLTAGRALLGISLRSVAAAPVPLTVPQHRLLVMISSHGPRRIGAVATDLGVNQSNASRLVDRLVDQGLVRRSPDPRDARASAVELTDAGRRALDAVTALRLAELRTIASNMPSSSRRAVVSALRDFSNAAHEDETSSS